MKLHFRTVAALSSEAFVLIFLAGLLMSGGTDTPLPLVVVGVGTWSVVTFVLGRPKSDEPVSSENCVSRREQDPAAREGELRAAGASHSVAALGGTRRIGARPQ